MQEKSFSNINTPVRYIKGVGPKKSEILERIGVRTIEDILYYLPKRYEDRSNIIPIKDLKVGESQTVQGEILVSGLRTSKAGVPIFQIALSDSTGIVYAVWFNQPYLKEALKKGDRVVLYGKVERYDRLQIMQPEFEVLEEVEEKGIKGEDKGLEGKVKWGDEGLEGKEKGKEIASSPSGPRNDKINSLNIGRIVPIYTLTAQITQRFLRGLIFNALEEHTKSLTERLPTYMIARERLVDIKFAIRNIHFPANFAMLEKAYRRIVFDEFLTLQLALALRKKGAAVENPALGHSIMRGALSEAFKESLPFEFTDGQKKAIVDIERDMSRTRPMNRLLEGDVGSGKTVVAAHALVLAAQNGFQAVLMAPTEVLARQHFIVLSELLMPLGINITLLIGGLDAKTRQRIYSEIKEGAVNVVVGTHAIIQEGIEFKRLGLAVIDEQHKFGVEQRAALRNKGLKGGDKGLEGDARKRGGGRRE